MPLHPQVQALIDAADPHRPQMHELTPRQARAQASGLAEAIGPGPAVARVEDISIAGTIPARVYAPERAAATVVWFHGGGWVIGGLDTHDAMCRTLANAARATVVSVAYRLAPEHRFPAALEDAWTALRWAGDADLPAPLIVGGDSAGGNLATVCALRARDRGGPRLALQVLVYPVTDCDLTRPSYAAGPMLNKRTMAWFWDQYVPDPAERADPEASPLRAPDLAELPPAVVVTAEHDPLRDEGRAYAQRLRHAGVAVSAHHYDDMAHPFFALVNLYERSAEAIQRVAEQIRASAAALPARTAAG
jgi:acetyl esterase